MKIKYLYSLYQVMLMPGFFKILRDLKSYLRFNFVHSALDSGLILALDSSKSYEQLVDELQVSNTELLDALLDVGVSIGELSHKNELYSLKGKISKAVSSEKGEALGALIQANATYYNSAYRNLTGRLKGQELSDDLEHIGNLVAKASKIQEPFIKHFIADAVGGNGRMKLLEIGCGSGAFMKAAYEANNNLSGLGIDCDKNVVRQAADNISKWGLNDRFDIAFGDIRTFDIGDDGPFDYISLYNVLYYFTSKEQVDLIRKLRSSLSPKGKLAIVTTTKSNGKDPMAANLNLVNCSLKGVSAVPHLAIVQKVLAESGYGTVQTTPLLPGSAVYFILAQ